MKLNTFTKRSCSATVVMCTVLGGGFFSTANSQTSLPEELRAGFDMITRGELDSAETFFEQSSARDKHDVWAITGLGVVYLRRAETTTQAFEILLKLLKQDNNSKAIKQFHAALALQPEFLEARYYLGRSLINQRNSDGYNDATEELTTVVQRDSLFRDTLYQLGLAHLGMEKWERALVDFHSALRLLPEDRRPAVKVAEAFFELGDPSRASESYLTNIGSVRDGEFLKEVFDPIRPLCTKDEKDEFDSLPTADKAAFVRRFWRKRDPTPGTAENERLQEHYRRLKFARANFAMPVKPYYDDRGKVFLRYGMPERRFVSPLYQGNVKSNESWSYENLQKNLVFDFVEEGGIFREVDDLSQAAGVGTPFASRYVLAANLYAERSDLSQLYARLGMLVFANANELSSRLSEVSAAKHHAQSAASPEMYRHNYNARPLEFAFNWAEFRGSDGQTRTEFYLGVPAKQLGLRRQDEKNLLSQLDCAVVVEDSGYDEVTKSTWSRQYVAEDSSEFRNAYPLLQRAVDLPPGNYQLTLQIANPEGKGLGIYRMPLSVRSFAGDTMMLSDIQFAFSVQPAEGQDDFVKNNLSVKPYPMDSLLRSRPIYLYYEIYNLSTDTDNRSTYRVEYEARVLRQDRSFFKSLGALFGGGKKRGVSSSHQQEGFGNVAHAYIALDLGNLPKGTVEVSVRVTDERSGRAAQTARRITLQD